MTEFRLPIRIYVEDTDAGGIVFYANYLKYMERARTELMRSLGFDKPALFDGLQFVVHEVALKYHSPAVLDDEITVTAVLSKASRATFEMTQQVFRGEELLVEGCVKVACIDAQTKRPKGMPKNMYTTLNSQLG
ncbi:MAG: tol-pal system-associated acyl-CoA thioesterase [Porticoccaceae bacterium]|jgi:4-hydroxybenzoyl-CoA thioesterase/acyl-CoA thioester hydrolase|nr:tol-pal system-associated acyl-CoA thioesterase [Porticoccaceae bacterium]